MMSINIKKISKSNQEQAVASWVNYLNQLRLDKLTNALNTQNKNLHDALEEIDKTLFAISDKIIERNRGGNKGMHGFIAEVAECGCGNAEELVKGKMPIYEWINDNGPADFLKNGKEFQQKFVNSGGHLSLQAIQQHLKKYPWFISNGGKYQIPQDHYERIRYLLSISPKQAYKMQTSDGTFSLKQWQEVQDFFRDGKIKLDDIEPSRFTYNSVQANKISESLSDQKKMIRETDSNIRKEAYERSMPTLKEGMKVASLSALTEGGAAFMFAVVKKKKEGKNIKEFSLKDWEDILKASGIGGLKGSVRGVSIYMLTNHTATSAAVANSIVTASFGMAEQAHRLRKGEISESDFIMNSEIICLDATVSALSSFLGQALIPIPIIGAVVGNTVGTLMYQIAKDNLLRKEQKILKEYLCEIAILDRQLDLQYIQFLKKIDQDLIKYYNLLENAFSPNYKQALDGSVALAISLGVPNSKLLKNKDEIDDYFLN